MICYKEEFYAVLRNSFKPCYEQLFFIIVMSCSANGVAYQSDVLARAGCSLPTLLSRLAVLEEWGFVKIDTVFNLGAGENKRAKAIAVNSAMARRSFWEKTTAFYYPFDIVLSEKKIGEIALYERLVRKAAEEDRLVGRAVLFAESIISEAKDNGRITPSQIATLSKMGVNPKWKKKDDE
jgi:hypothetical protein